MPVLGDNGKSDESAPVAKPVIQAASPAAPTAASEPAAATVALEPAPSPAPQASVAPAPEDARLAGTAPESLSAFDPGLSLEENYRRLQRAHTLLEGDRTRALLKVEKLAEVVKQMSELVK